MTHIAIQLMYICAVCMVAMYLALVLELCTLFWFIF